MINKDLIELQEGCKATCVVILDEEINKLDYKIVISSKSSDSELYVKLKENVFDNEKIHYLIVKDIDEINENEQDKYYQMVKDRELYGHKLPENIIIVLTVKNRESLKRISQELYKFCVVAF